MNMKICRNLNLTRLQTGWYGIITSLVKEFEAFISFKKYELDIKLIHRLTLNSFYIIFVLLLCSKYLAILISYFCYTWFFISIIFTI